MPKKLTQEQAIEKAKRIHGDKYDLSKLVYTKSKEWVTVGCKVHGDFRVIFRDFTKKEDTVGCQKCSKEVCLAGRTMWNKISEEDAINRMVEVHGSKFDYSNLQFNGFCEKANIICPTHGAFSMKPDEHITSKYGCPKCGILNAATARMKSKESWINSLPRWYHDIYDYSSVPDNIGSTTHFEVTCRAHGKFVKTWASHVRSPCPGCSRDRLSKNSSSTTDEFIKKARNIHGDRYSYDLVDYKSSKCKVHICCKVHGGFLQKPNKHLSGQGCPKCANNGFRTTKGGTLYVLSDGESVKVGITNRKVSTRVSEINKSRVRKFVISREFYFSDGQTCANKEAAVLNKLRSIYEHSDEVFSGFTETFKGADLCSVLEMVEEVVYG